MAFTGMNAAHTHNTAASSNPLTIHMFLNFPPASFIQMHSPFQKTPTDTLSAGVAVLY
jgi:hypothetical protein